MRRRRAADVLAAMAALAVVVAVVPPPDVSAAPLGPAEPLAPAAPSASAAPDPAPPPGTGLSPPVAAVPASSPALDRAEAELAAVTRRLERDTAELGAVGEDIEQASVEQAGTAGLVARRGAQLTKARASAEQLRADLSVLATEWYVNGFGAQEQLNPALSARELAELDQQQVLAEAAATDTLRDVGFVSRRVDRLVEEQARLTERAAELDRRVAELVDRRDRLSLAVVEAQAGVVRWTDAVALERLNATVDGTDLSTIALDAYWRAQGRLAAEDPTCNVRWWQIAGIARTESRHGTFGGARVGVDGRVSVPIMGPPLDGSNSFAVVADSDGGLLDGTATTDRAVGPMQFLPSTWTRLGRDGTGDGVADPQNLYDAALSTGGYLCRSGPLVDLTALRNAYYSYNHSVSYVDAVVGHAEDYRAAVPL